MLRGWGNIRCMGRRSNIFKVLFSFCQSSYRGHLGHTQHLFIHPLADFSKKHLNFSWQTIHPHSWSKFKES